MSSNNIKVHFAGSDNSANAISALKSVGVNYRLYTAYPFIANSGEKKDRKIIENHAGFNHIIIDSGLFTLMFGADKNKKKTPEMIRDWMHRLVNFVKNQNFESGRVSVVEVDAQKVISPEFTWEIRKEMRQLLPKQEIINVFHLEDGKNGFEKICEFSDYIAISVPELRIAQPKNYKNTTCALARLARNIHPGIKIHLLGCTEQSLLKSNRFCTSADSSSWLSFARYGFIGKNHVSNLSKESIAKANREVEISCKKLGFEYKKPTIAGEKSVASYYYGALKSLKDYEKWCGKQD